MHSYMIGLLLDLKMKNLYFCHITKAVAVFCSGGVKQFNGSLTVMHTQINFPKMNIMLAKF